jgi:hypothetical protein
VLTFSLTCSLTGYWQRPQTTTRATKERRKKGSSSKEGEGVVGVVGEAAEEEGVGVVSACVW